MQLNSRLVKSRLKELRKQHLLTQAEVAELVGLTVATYSRYEKGLYKLESGMLCKLAEYYGVSVDYILVRTDEPHMYKKKFDNYIDFSMKYNSLNEDKKEILTAIIDAIAAKKAD